MDSLISQTIFFLTAAVIVVPIFKRIGLGSVLGYLAAGILIGPKGLGLVSQVETILHFSEIGVVFLLFVIGLELRPARLWQMRRDVFGFGGAQVIVTGLLFTAVIRWTGLDMSAAIVIGFSLSLSSTAFALQIMAEKNQLATPHGRAGFSMLLFQDLAVIPILVFLPTLAGAEAGSHHENSMLSLAVSVGTIAFVVFAGRSVVTPMLRALANTKNQELFTASALLLVLGMAAIMEFVGLSMGLGAFLAGVLLADSEFRHALETDVEPFKGLLLGLFFIAIGMSLNLNLLAEEPALILKLVAAIVLIKGLVLFVLGKLNRLCSTDAVKLGITLSQGGEFAFVVFAQALEFGLFEKETLDLLTVVVGLSMITTPLLLILSDRLFKKRSQVQSTGDMPADMPEETPTVIIAGFGRFGQIIGRVLALQHVPFTALDKDASHVGFVSQFGIKSYFGDAARLDLLRSAHVEEAKLFILAVDDVEESMKIATIVRQHFPDLKIIARARNRLHAYRLLDLGITDVFRETFGSSLAAAEEALTELGMPDLAALETIHAFRDYDSKHIREASEHHGDPEKLMELAKEGRKELEQLFQQDLKDN